MPELDDLDQAIITALEQDGRRAFREIARSLDVSEGTVRARFRRLEDAGILKIAAFADPGRFRDGRLALLLLRVAPGRHDAVVASLTAHPEISYVSTTVGGRADVFAQVLVRNDTALWAFLQTHVRSLEGVLDTECVIEVAVHKLWFDGGATARTADAPPPPA